MSHKQTIAMVLVLAAFVSGCVKLGSDKPSAQKTLSDYIARSFAVKAPADKANLIELTTGEVKTTLESLDEEAFRRFFIDTKREFISLKVKDERKLSSEQHAITYELTYMSAGKDSKDRVTNKKYAVFVQQDGKWVISEVRNLKTFIEHQNEISF